MSNASSLYFYVKIFSFLSKYYVLCNYFFVFCYFPPVSSSTFYAFYERMLFIMDAGYTNDTATGSVETRADLVNSNYLFNKADVTYDFPHGPGVINVLMLSGHVTTVRSPAQVNYSMYLN